MPHVAPRPNEREQSLDTTQVSMSARERTTAAILFCRRSGAISRPIIFSNSVRLPAASGLDIIF